MIFKIRWIRHFLFFFTISVVFAKEKGHSFDLKKLDLAFEQNEKELSHSITGNPRSLRAWSKRGDMRLFLGKFEDAKSDYEKMIQLDPALEVSHWRLGIAYFYLEDYDKAAHQFQIYHNFDAVDRENGIWRFMSQFKSKGLKTAREGLLKYEKDDRPPYPLLYEMFAGRLKPEDVFLRIEQANYSESFKERVLFHGCLYVGIYLELVDNKKIMAENLLKKAFENKYGQSTGTYMWQVARLHYFQLMRENKTSSMGKDSSGK